MDKTQNNFEQQLFSITTLIEGYVIKEGKQYSYSGSGFFYNEEIPDDPTKTGPQWYKLDKFCLITNRHVALPKIEGIECLPDQFTFSLREQVNGKIEWKPITLSKDQLQDALMLHPDRRIDVVIIDITKYIQSIIEEIRKNPDAKIYIPTALSNLKLPENQPFTIDVTSDIVIASYPKKFYDKFNKFPIVKSGIVASGWGMFFNGLPMFQIDAQLFPGSSGGLVISKPTNFATIDGQLKKSEKKQFAFLGIYSGEYTWPEEIKIKDAAITVNRSFGLGNVWYSSLVPEILKSGVKFDT